MLQTETNPQRLFGKNTENLLNESNTEHNFSFLTSFGEIALQCGAKDFFNELYEDYSVSMEEYGYAESENEVIDYLKRNFGTNNPNEYVVEIRLLPDDERLYKHGSFIKNGEDTGDDYQYWFEEHGGEPTYEYQKDGTNYFVGFVIDKINRK